MYKMFMYILRCCFICVADVNLSLMRNKKNNQCDLRISPIPDFIEQTEIYRQIFNIQCQKCTHRPLTIIPVVCSQSVQSALFRQNLSSPKVKLTRGAETQVDTLWQRILFPRRTINYGENITWSCICVDFLIISTD